MDNRLSLDALRYLQLVADTGSISAAAKAAGISQPALSKCIRRLEESLGEELLVRTKQGVEPTEFAKQVIPLAGAAVEAADRISALAQARRELPRDSLRLGVSPLMNPKLIAVVHAALRDLSGPEAKLQLIVQEANLAELREQLQAGELDFVLGPAVSTAPGLSRKIIDWEPLHVVDYSHPTPPESVDISELSGLPLVTVSDTCGLTRYTKEVLDQRRLDYSLYPGEAMSYAILEEWASLGMGQAILPESKLTVSAGRTSRLCDEGNTVEIFYEAIWDPRSPMIGIIVPLVEAIADTISHN